MTDTARLTAERDAARDLAVHALHLVDWRTPSWQVNPDDPAGVIAARGVAIFEPGKESPVTAIAHMLGIGALIDLIVHALHLHGVHHLNVDRAGAHHAWIDTRHWLITIRWIR